MPGRRHRDVQKLTAHQIRWLAPPLRSLASILGRIKCRVVQPTYTFLMLETSPLISRLGIGPGSPLIDSRFESHLTKAIGQVDISGCPAGFVQKASSLYWALLGKPGFDLALHSSRWPI